MLSTKTLPQDLLIAKELVYDAYGIELADHQSEAESLDYGACTFSFKAKC